MDIREVLLPKKIEYIKKKKENKSLNYKPLQWRVARQQ